MVLVDTNILSVWLFAGDPNWDRIDAFLQRLGPEPIAASEITRGEIEYGLAMGTLSAEQKADVRTRLDAMPVFWRPVDASVASTYGALRGALFAKYAPRDARGNVRKKRIELLPLPGATAIDLQIEENDLWIASTAITLDVPIATRDQGFDAIINICPPEFAYTHPRIAP